MYKKICDFTVTDKSRDEHFLKVRMNYYKDRLDRCKISIFTLTYT